MEGNGPFIRGLATTLGVKDCRFGDDGEMLLCAFFEEQTVGFV